MNVDRYQYCDATDIAADAPMMSLVPLESRDFMGGAAMIARHLAGLGAEPTLIASFGRDAASDEAIDSLESLGVHVLPLRNRKKIALRTRFVVDNQKVFLLDESHVTPTDSASEKWISEEVQRLANPESTMVVYDAGLGIFSDRMMFDMIRGGHHGYAKCVGGTAGSRGRLARLTWADMLVATERGLRVAMRDYEQGISSIACRMLDDLHAKALLMPSGRKGLFCFDVHPNAAEAVGWEGKLRSEYLSNQANGSIDKLGCQEALLAVAAAMLGSGANIHQAAYVALAASIIESRQPGHQPLDGHELRQMLEQNLPE
jgi:bifunctional ADP-heptose synthase (sugar kinase/adenylyltransferase)